MSFRCNCLLDSHKQRNIAIGMHGAKSFSRLESDKNPQLQASPFGMAEPGLVYSGGVESFAIQARLAVPEGPQIQLWVGKGL